MVVGGTCTVAISPAPLPPPSTVAATTNMPPTASLLTTFHNNSTPSSSSSSSSVTSASSVAFSSNIASVCSPCPPSSCRSRLQQGWRKSSSSRGRVCSLRGFGGRRFLLLGGGGGGGGGRMDSLMPHLMDTAPFRGVCQAPSHVRAAREVMVPMAFFGYGKAKLPEVVQVGFIHHNSICPFSDPSFPRHS